MSISYSICVAMKMKPNAVQERWFQEFGWTCGEGLVLNAPSVVLWLKEMESGFLKDLVLEDYGFDPTVWIRFQVDGHNYKEGERSMLSVVLAVLAMEGGDVLFMMDEVPLLLRRSGQLVRFKQFFWREELVALLPHHETQENPVGDDL